MISITLHCDGCDAVAPGGNINSEFVSLSGRDHGFGAYEHKTKWDPPCGWVLFDPYTQCTYCPECWQDIESA